MLLTITQLKDLAAKLHAGGTKASCKAPNETAPVFVEKPKTRHTEGHKYPSGDVLVKHEGKLGIFPGPGIHGRAFLGIDPETGKISCTKCAKKGGE